MFIKAEIAPHELLSVVDKCKESVMNITTEVSLLSPIVYSNHIFFFSIKNCELNSQLNIAIEYVDNDEENILLTINEKNMDYATLKKYVCCLCDMLDEHFSFKTYVNFTNDKTSEWETTI